MRNRRLVIQAHRLVIHRLVIRRLVIHRLVTHTGWLYKTKVRYNQPAKYCRLVITVLTNLHLGVQVGYQAGWLSQVGYCIWPVWCVGLG